MGMKPPYGRPRKYASAPDLGTPELQKRRAQHPGTVSKSRLHGLYDAGWIDEAMLVAGQRYARLAFAAFRSMGLRVCVKSQLRPLYLRGSMPSSFEDACVEQHWRNLCAVLPQDVKRTLDSLLLYPGDMQPLSRKTVCRALQALCEALKA